MTNNDWYVSSLGLGVLFCVVIQSAQSCPTFKSPWTAARGGFLVLHPLLLCRDGYTDGEVSLQSQNVSRGQGQVADIGYSCA